MRLLLAFRMFFSVLFHRETAQRAALVLEPPASAQPTAQPTPPKAKPAPKCSEAILLLAVLQREARFIDFTQEPLADYTDAQIGAAAREVHRECAKVLERLFQLKPLVAETEGAEVEIPAGFDAGRFRIVGNVTGEPPFRGKVVHHGWQALECQLPAWSGSAEATRVIAPAEVDIP